MTRDDLKVALQSPRVRAFLHALRMGEGTSDHNGYRRLVGGGEFDSYADHPRVMRRVAGVKSTAAGAYQFLAKTWDGLVERYGFPDFSPACQDEAAVALIAGRGALDEVIAGGITAAVALCNKEWASLPGSPYGQPTVSMEQFTAEYKRCIAAITGTTPSERIRATPPPLEEQPPAPIVELSRDATPEEISVSQPVSDAWSTAATVGEIALGVVMPQTALLTSIAKAAIPALVQYAPDLVRIFNDKDAPVSERNTAAALKVLEIAQSATGTANAQAAAEALALDPAAQNTFAQAVKDQWYTLSESGGGGIEGAAKRAADMSAGGWRAMLGNPAFVITLVLLPLVYGTIYQVLTDASWSAEIRASIVSAVVSGVLFSVTGFWLGTSFGSHRKTDLLLAREG